MQNTTNLIIENNGQHIAKIVDAIPCERHSADIGDPCWTLQSLNGPLKSICNGRAQSAGARGQVTPYYRNFNPKDNS